ncbi:MAG: DEAD/DEAH box helicase [Nannocystaceae bacterium]|nr:DEAD/DEAH box helicase [Nannocystaceae bacterium]
MPLRPYQREAVDAVVSARREGIRRMLLALPTGAGKTVIFAELIRRARHPVLVLAHREELLAQAQAKIAAALHGDRRTVEIEQGLARASRQADVVVASIRSLHDGRIGAALSGRGSRLVIYDECHHAVAPDNRRVLERIGAFEPQWPGTLVGFTATTRRADGRALGEVFERIVYQRSLRQMIDERWLRPLRGLRIDTGVDLAAVPQLGDDFDEEPLAQTIDVEARNLLVARSIQELARDRRTIAFCVTVRHAEHLCEALRGLGVPAGMICGEMPRAARAAVLARFRSGALAVLTNVGVLTEGFDDPGVSAIAMVRPTRSEALYLQCVGRGMRLDRSAPDCLVLDFVDLSRLELVTTPTLDASDAPEQPPRPEAGAGAVPPVTPGLDDGPAAPATLAEIHARLAAFDPLALQQREELAAISRHAWLSLGAHGLMLHFHDHAGALRCFTLRPVRRSSTAVWLDDRELGRFGSMHDAVAAVDETLPRHGDPASAAADAPWRRAAVPPVLRDALAALQPPRFARDAGEAIAHLALEQALRAVAAKPTRSVNRRSRSASSGG